MQSTRPPRGLALVAHATAGGRSDPTAAPPTRTVALAAAAVTLLAAAPAHAGDAWPHGWRNGDRPRRHKRQMGGSRFDLFPDDAARLYLRGEKKRPAAAADAASSAADLAIIDRAADSVAELVEEAASAASRVGRVLRRAKAALVRGGGGDAATGFTVSASAPASLGVDPTPRRTVPSSAPSAETVATIGTGAAAVAAVAAAIAAVASLRSAWARSRRSGRWVRDRSLGGKLVWVDEGGSVTPAGRRPPPPADLLPLTGDDVVPNEWDEASASAQAAAAAPTPSTLPAWWQPPSLVRTAAAPAAEAVAAPILATLQEAKLLGRDYDVDSLVRLRLALGTSGGRARPRADNVRDAIFRAAASAAVDAAATGAGASALGGVPPASLVAGLAADLGVPDAHALNMALAAAAAKARALLVDAAAAARAAGGDPGAALLPLAALAALLKELPLAGDEPQIPLVAAAIGQRASLAERRALFLEYGRAVDRGSAGVVASMLGFDPALVVGQLG